MTTVWALVVIGGVESPWPTSRSEWENKRCACSP